MLKKLNKIRKNLNSVNEYACTCICSCNCSGCSCSCQPGHATEYSMFSSSYTGNPTSSGQSSSSQSSQRRSTIY